MKKAFYLLSVLGALMVTNTASSQGFLKKLKDKVSSAVSTVTSVTGNKNSTQPAEGEGGQTNSNSNSTTSSGTPTNKGGGGLTNTAPPDVKAQIADAESAHAAKN